MSRREGFRIRDCADTRAFNENEPTITSPVSPTAAAASRDALVHRVSCFSASRRLTPFPAGAACTVLSSMKHNTATDAAANIPLSPSRAVPYNGDPFLQKTPSQQQQQRQSMTAETVAPPPSCGCERLAAEDDEGDVEYKWRLTGISDTRFEHLVTQMQFRVTEGSGQCLYQLGVADDGVPRGISEEEFGESVRTIARMADALQFDCTVLQRCVVREATMPEGDNENGKGNAKEARQYHEDHAVAPTASKVSFSRSRTSHATATGSAGRLVCGEILVTRRHAATSMQQQHDIRVAFCGAIRSGKSTLMSVVLSSTLDDGDGFVRQLLFNHKHEVDSGRTTSITTRVWPLEDGDVMHQHQQQQQEEFILQHENMISKTSSSCVARAVSSDGLSSNISLSEHHGGGSSGGEHNSSSRHTSPNSETHCRTLGNGATHQHAVQPKRSITLMDTGGDMGKSMLFGLMSRSPEFVCICVAADVPPDGVSVYASLCLAVRIQFFVVVTRCDLLEDFEVDSFLMELAAELDRVGCACEVVETPAMATDYCEQGNVNLHSGYAKEQRGCVPILCVSSVTGTGLDTLRGFLSSLPHAKLDQQQQEKQEHQQQQVLAYQPRERGFEVFIDFAFIAKDVGPVVRGRVTAGAVRVGSACLVGPDDAGQFHDCVIRGVHVDGAHVNEALTHDECTFALDCLPDAIDCTRKGKLLLQPPSHHHRVFPQLRNGSGAAAAVVAPRPTRMFCARVQLLAQQITQQLQPILYTRNVRQAVRILSCTRFVEEGEERFDVVCELMFAPEVLVADAPLVLQWTPNGVAAGHITTTTQTREG